MIFSNHENNSGKIRNLQKMLRRRNEFIMVNLQGVGLFTYNFEVVNYLNTGDYKQFLNVYDLVIFAIRERFEKEEIDFDFQGSSRSS